MPKYKMIIVRAAIIDEYYEVEVDSEEEAINIAQSGELGDPFKTDFVDWKDDEWQVCDTEEIEPLYQMVKDYRKEEA